MTGAVTVTGTATRIEICVVHGIPFPQSFFPHVPGQEAFWSGECGLCRQEASVLARARQMEAETKGETYRLSETLMATEQEIQASIDAAVDSYVEDARQEAVSRRADFDLYIRELARENSVAAATESRVAEFVEQLRKAR